MPDGSRYTELDLLCRSPANLRGEGLQKVQWKRGGWMGHSIMCNLGTTRGLYSVALASPASALPSTSSSEHSPVPFLTSRRVTTKGRSPRLGKDTQCVRYYITQDLLRSPDTAGLGKRRENRLFAVAYAAPAAEVLHPMLCLT